MHIKQAVIFAGGLGERLKPFTNDNPKPMYPFHGKPFLEYLLEQVKGFGITDVILLLGYLPERIMDHFGDGSGSGMRIRYCVTPVECDTQMRIAAAVPMLDDDFLMMYCDNICPVDFGRLVSDYEKNGAWLQLTAYANCDGYTKDNLKLGDGGRVLLYDKKRESDGLSGVDIGYAIVSKKVFDLLSDGNDNFERIVYPQLVEKQKLFATVTGHRYYSIGSNQRLLATGKYLSGRKFIFLDRDGVLNIRPPKAEYVRRPEQFTWIPGSRQAVKRLNDAGYSVITVSNQAGIARGIMTLDDFEAVQKVMKDDLADIGAKIEASYCCPHGWDEGCSCRKPRPGMLYRAQQDYCLNLTECVFIGDDERDMQAANAAGMNGIFVSDSYPLEAAVNDYLAGNPRYWEECA